MTENKDKSLKIGIFVDTYYPVIDGVIVCVDNYARGLSKYADVTVFTTETPSFSVEDDLKRPYRIVRCGALKAFKIEEYVLPLPSVDIDFNAELYASRLDIVHINSPFTIGLAGLRYAYKYGIPAVATVHSQFKKDFETYLKFEPLVEFALEKTMTVFDMADEIWVPNRRMQELYKIYGGKLEPYIHPNATDLRPIENRDERVRELYRDYGITENETVFLFVGRLIERKNIFFIARALGILKQKCEKAFKMIYVGAGPDEERLRSLIKDEGIEENVIISGRISDRAKLADFYAAADLFLFPSLYDTNSLVQIEAASQGTPTLFLRDSVTSSSIEEDVSGYIAEDSVDAYAEKMLEIMNKSPENKAFVRENVVKDVYKHWEELVIEMLERFVELADSKSARRDLSYEEIFSDFFLNTKNKNRPDFDEIKRLFQKLESRGKSDIEAAMKAMWESFK
jgi:1,2-diacylglycerol 3-alpha-glucosyltransferase